MSRQRGTSGDPTVQGALKNREKLIALQRQKDMADVLSTPAGRRVMYDVIFHRCNVMGVYPGQDSGIYRHEGGRALGAAMLVEMQEQHSDAYLTMIKESVFDQKNERQLKEAAETRKEETPDA